jgi:hypothetical protein
MKPAQRNAVYHLLGTHDKEAIGRWADSVRPLRDDSEHRWHYVDIPLEADEYDFVRDCRHDCIIAELERVRATLHDKSLDSLTRREALLFWFHLVGDLYQPFHCYNNNDRGANKLKVIYQGKPHIMHKLWDERIIKDHNPSAWSLASHIYRKYPYPTIIPNFVQAANLSHSRAIEAALQPGEVVSSKYLRHEWSVIQHCLWEAGCMAAEVEL